MKIQSYFRLDFLMILNTMPGVTMSKDRTINFRMVETSNRSAVDLRFEITRPA